MNATGPKLVSRAMRRSLEALVLLVLVAVGLPGLHGGPPAPGPEFTVSGLWPGLGRAQVLDQRPELRRAGDFRFASGSGFELLMDAEGRITWVHGDILERHGRPVLRKGDPAPRVFEVLGAPHREHHFGRTRLLIYDQGRRTVQLLDGRVQFSTLRGPLSAWPEDWWRAAPP